MLGQGMPFYENRNHDQFGKVSADIPPFVTGALFRGAPVGAALYLVSRLLTGKKIKPIDLVLSALGGGLIGGAAYHMMYASPPSGGAEGEKEPPHPQTTINDKNVNEVVPPIKTPSGKNIGEKVQVEYRSSPSARESIGNSPAYNVFAEMHPNTTVPTVSSAYRVWLGHAAESAFHAGLVREYVSQTVRPVLGKQTDQFLNLAEQRVLEARVGIRKILTGEDRQFGSIDSLIRVKLTQLGNDVDEFLNDQGSSLNKITDDNLREAYKQEIMQLVKPLFYSSLVLNSTNLSPNNLSGKSDQKGNNTPSSVLSTSAEHSYNIGNDYKDNFLMPVLVDTLSASAFDVFMSKNQGLNKAISNFYKTNYIDNNKIADLYNQIFKHHFPGGKHFENSDIFSKVISNLESFNAIGNKSSPGVYAYLREVVSPVAGSALNTLEVFTVSLMPKDLVHEQIDPSDYIFRFSDTGTSNWYRTIGAGAGGILGSRIGSRMIAKSFPSAPGSTQGKSLLRRVTVGIGTALPGVVPGGLLGSAAGGTVERGVSKYIWSDPKIITQDVRSVISNYGLKGLSSINLDSLGLIKGIDTPPPKALNPVPTEETGNKQQSLFFPESETERRFGLKLAFHNYDNSDNFSGYISGLVKRSQLMGYFSEGRQKWV